MHWLVVDLSRGGLVGNTLTSCLQVLGGPCDPNCLTDLKTKAWFWGSWDSPTVFPAKFYFYMAKILISFYSFIHFFPLYTLRIGAMPDWEFGKSPQYHLELKMLSWCPPDVNSLGRKSKITPQTNQWGESLSHHRTENMTHDLVLL